LMSPFGPYTSLHFSYFRHYSVGCGLVTMDMNKVIITSPTCGMCFHAAAHHYSPDKETSIDHVKRQSSFCGK